MEKILFSILLMYTVTFAQNEAYLVQTNGNGSEAIITQSFGNNVLTGPELLSSDNLVEGSNGLFQSAAFQRTNYGKNELKTIQENAFLQNKIELFQVAGEDNIGEFRQSNGSHTLKINEISIFGSNESHITQENGNGYISLLRYARDDNYIPTSTDSKMDFSVDRSGVYQNGSNNNIFGAYPTGNLIQPTMYDENSPAVQISLLGSNWMEIYQTGDNNNVGLVQTSSMNNEALIRQTNDDNTIAVVQTSGLGSNYLYVEQTGNNSLYIYQSSFSGDNAAVVIQH